MSDGEDRLPADWHHFIDDRLAALQGAALQRFLRPVQPTLDPVRVMPFTLPPAAPPHPPLFAVPSRLSYLAAMRCLLP